jgi:cell division protease FtsH
MADPAPRGTQGQQPAQHRPGWKVEGARTPHPAPARPRRRLPFGTWFWVAVLLGLVANQIIFSRVSQPPGRLSISYTYFLHEVSTGNVRDISSTGYTLQGDFRRVTKPEPGTSGKASSRFQTEVPIFATGPQLIRLLISHGAKINAKPTDTSPSFLEQLVLGFGPTLLLVGLFVILARRMAGTARGGPLGAFGRSRAQLYDSGQRRVTFEDVAGIDEAEEELAEVVDFLRNAQKYTRLGARVPKGVLLSGPPGTGKTLLARAVAGEAGVPFFSISASEFIEAIVGVGASRVRDLFSQAKASAPAIVFIDELDAIGRARGAGAGFGGHDEREQTLNQILTEMDGFTGSEGVIVVASTNRPDVLDPALLRPGRFDRRVTVAPPDLGGRRAILTVHTRGVPLADGIDLEAIAASTPGMVGADLANLVNEAALTAARRGHDQVQTADFTDSLERIVLGAERRIMLSADERERTAYHESGHALLGMLQPGADPVRKISIIPRGLALGVTFQAPDADRYGYSVEYLRGRLIGALGGRAAERLVYDDLTTGAESDLEQATRIARQMVGRWGMSEVIGPVSVLPGPDGQPQFFPGGTDGVSEQTRELVDGEVRRILEECEEAAMTQLRANRERLEALTRALLKTETLDEVDAYRIAGIGRTPSSETAPV